MKTTINGHVVEGTPQEIRELVGMESTPTEWKQPSTSEWEQLEKAYTPKKKTLIQKRKKRNTKKTPTELGIGKGRHLTDDQLRTIWELHLQGVSPGKIGKMYKKKTSGIKGVIDRIKKGDYNHRIKLDLSQEPIERKRSKRGVGQYVKFTPEMVERVRTLARQGLTRHQIVKEMNVPYSSVAYQARRHQIEIKEAQFSPTKFYKKMEPEEIEQVRTEEPPRRRDTTPRRRRGVW